ncbi:transketolase [Trichococcus flocculiformis]|uniref:transketolase-like TK C-terminal-containing protein n=1 Tax=Trichococcus TaxID=82802 RepID=UPI0007A8493E|nr:MULTISPECIES: hypothetical protein [Trichococcus]CZR05823.1 Hypothetical protein TES5_2227 [Trichococcus sp. ES5]SHF88387.1 transketolase [Trichococcus flocculiformis]
MREHGQDCHCVLFLLSFHLFDQHTPPYQKVVLSKAVTKHEMVEVAATFGWERYFESAVKVIGIDHFGASAPGDRILREFGFTIENVVVICNRL